MADVSTTFLTGRKSSIGTSPTQITSDLTKADEGVLIYADKNNTATLYVGSSSSITADSSDSTDGFPLDPGDSVVMRVRNPSSVYVLASTGSSSKLWWLIV